MTARLGEWIMRSGEELKLLLPPFDAASRFTERLELKREGARLLIRATRGGDVRWQIGVELPRLPAVEVRPMPDEEFNGLLRADLRFKPTREYLALFVLTQTVPGATEALRGWAAERDAQDAAAVTEAPWNPEGRQ